ncbi:MULTISPECIES: TraR/DksA family transcriptional regulator [Streptomyces]|uniref:TraR/DksA family transcriptional regulator n=1 Tax=Streptomyces TaxID=1883 RepID=UPI002248A261|nr:TraR/DksA C4-type zinc finger protein [Streptomyces sp. JHD 1]MCX2971424.1 TraR/DksA C4-type zinc finger protein [Streptomyces sp. JHD 1]
MPPDTARPESRPERLAGGEARQRLEHERHARLEQLKAIEEAGGEADDHLAVAQRDSLRRVLKDIDAAFGRIEDGTYGTCRDCGRSIPVERLEILPYAHCCVGCQQRSG